MSFSGDVTQWVKMTKADADAVYGRAVEKIGEEMTKTRPQGGRVPFLTGNLARSLLASTEAMPKTSDTPSVGSNIGIVAAKLKIGQPVWLGYQAIYARRQNYGFIGADRLGRVYNQQGAYFIEGAIAEWPRIVEESIKEVVK